MRMTGQNENSDSRYRSGELDVVAWNTKSPRHDQPVGPLVEDQQRQHDFIRLPIAIGPPNKFSNGASSDNFTLWKA
jgi:hypothetical protein